jgi:hypothetical protein
MVRQLLEHPPAISKFFPHIPSLEQKTGTGDNPAVETWLFGSPDALDRSLAVCCRQISRNLGELRQRDRGGDAQVIRDGQNTQLDE